MNYNANNKYKFIVDFEATCFEKPNIPDMNEIIDIGVILCDDNFNVVYRWTKLVKPNINKKLSRFCKNLTNILQEDLDKADNFVNVVCEFRDEFQKVYNIQTNAIAWYSWGDWDLKCLIKNCERNNLEFPFGNYKNLRNVYVNVCNQGHNSKCGLREVIDKEKIEHIPSYHRALHDAEAAAKIAKFMRDSFRWHVNEEF